MDLLMSGAEARGLPVVLRDQDHAVADLYGAVTTPHFFLIDSNGILQYKGAFDDATFRQPDAAQDFLREALQAVQESRQPDPMETPGYGCAIIRFADGD
jgi:alkyl hydroperoxide reductase subunit AhpC